MLTSNFFVAVEDHFVKIFDISLQSPIKEYRFNNLKSAECIDDVIYVNADF